MSKSLMLGDDTNLGKYNISSLTMVPKKPDIKMYRNLVNHVNKLTDTVFLNVAYGIRTPAYCNAVIYYDTTSDSWLSEEKKGTTKNFIEFIDSSVNPNGELEFLDVSIYYSWMGLSDQTPLCFVFNQSYPKNYYYNQTIFPRIASLNHLDGTSFFARLALETFRDSDFTYYKPPAGFSGESGLRFYFESAFQSNIDHTDRLFYEPGIPYLYLNMLYARTDRFRISFQTYTDLDVDYTFVEWPCKVLFRTQKWTGDCTTGSGVGDFAYAGWETDYYVGTRELFFETLTPDTTYKIWYKINAKVGPDLLDWSTLGCYITKPLGDSPTEELPYTLGG